MGSVLGSQSPARITHATDKNDSERFQTQHENSSEVSQQSNSLRLGGKFGFLRTNTNIQKRNFKHGQLSSVHNNAQIKSTEDQ